jgi:hypothetical protein
MRSMVGMVGMVGMVATGAKDGISGHKCPG